MPQLTPKELKILKLVCSDKSNPEIAVKLKLSLRQTEKIKSGLYLKTKVRSNVGLLKWAVLNKCYTIKKR
jgi:DNA-binding CsgD family transcriptional regulator